MPGGGAPPAFLPSPVPAPPAWLSVAAAVVPICAPPMESTSRFPSILTRNGTTRSTAGTTITRSVLSIWNSRTVFTWGVPTGISDAAVPRSTPEISTMIRNGSISLIEV